MLNVDHSNIDGPPFTVKCVRKFGSALGEVTCACACLCVCWHNVPRADMYYPCREGTHSMAAVGFGIRFGLVIFENPGIDHKIMGITFRPWSRWTANSDKKLNVNKPSLTSRKTAFRLQKWNLAGICALHIPSCKFSKYFTKFFKI